MATQSKFKPLGEMEGLPETPERAYKVFFNNNMGNRTFLMTLPIFDFYRMSAIAHEANKDIDEEDVAQRPLDENHANKLANYILKGLISAVISKRQHEKEKIPVVYKDIQYLMGTQSYISFQPFVCNMRSSKRNGVGLRARPLSALNVTDTPEIVAYEVLLSQKDILWVIDGQHRRRAIQHVMNFFDHVFIHHTYPGKKSIFPKTESVSEEEMELWKECNLIAMSQCSIVAEVHLGLDTEEERQLFHDLNNLGKSVETSLALRFDRGNPINIFIQDELDEKLLQWTIEDKDPLDWEQDQGTITFKDLVSVNTRLLINKTNPRGATPADVEPKIKIALRFWQAVQKIPHIGKPKAKMKTVAAQPVMLKALAKLVYDFAFGREKNPQMLEKILKAIPSIDFSHHNPIWRYYEMDESQRKKHPWNGLKEYLPPPNPNKPINRDLGGFDHDKKLMRFGAKHNDIYPLLGDMIRWSLDLPSRH